MASLTVVTPVPDRGRELEQDEDMMQAGRSASGLAADRHSAELSTSAPSSETTRRDSTSFSIPESGAGSSLLARTSSTLSIGRRASSFVPVVPSPLNPSSSQASVHSTERNSGDPFPVDSSSAGTPPATRGSGNLPLKKKGKKKPNLSSPQAVLRKKSAPNLRPPSISQFTRPESPRHLKDLGRDYSRYPTNRTSSAGSLISGTRTPSGIGEASLLRMMTNNPFSDSEANLEKWGYPDDGIGAYDPYFGGEKGFILYTDEVEADDKYHMPADDDDQVYKPHWKEYCTRRSIVSTCGAAFLILGLLCVFIMLPILTFASNIYNPKAATHSGGANSDHGPEWAHVNDRPYELLTNVRRTLIDPDTPDKVKTRKSTFDDTEMELVFSDEFSKPGRTFYPGDDPYWTAPDIWYGATQDLEWYDPDAVKTANGTLQLRLDKFPSHNLQYRSGMLNSWNQLCFKGGVFEVSVSLAGPSGVPGLWPGAWTLGNLGRPGYKATTEGVWPYTYDSCDAGITPNQSDTSGISYLPGQKLSSCTCKGEDHPSPGTGRGAPEIDILEASVDFQSRIGVVTQSFQVAPFDVNYRPNSNFMQIPNYETTQMNTYCGGPFQQAVSGTSLLNNDWYGGKAYQKYAFEYVPGTSEGKIAWFVGEDQTFMMDGRAIGPNGNIQARQVSEEPMSMVLNLGISPAWTTILFDQLAFPTIMHIDYVRIYQKPGKTMLTCDPPGYPTTEYIKNHPLPYNNPNVTAWNETGYSWPKNTLMNSC